MKYTYLGLFLLLLTGLAQGHHSALAYFNMGETAEIEGVVTKVHWRNPHIRFSVEVTDDAGKNTGWDIELSALSSFRNRGYSNAFMKIGDKVKVYGNPAHQGRPAMSGLNMLLENGTEVVLEAGEDPYYALQNNAREFVIDTSDSLIEKRARESAEGIFRVWSTAIDDSGFPMFKGQYSLTSEAAMKKSEWVAKEEELEGCWSKTMPYMMITPAPIEFVRIEQDILLRFEEDDAQRLIHMDASKQGSRNQDNGAQPSPFGYSTGVWQGNSLVVETSRIDSPDFDDRGTPQSENMHLIERFTPQRNGEQLDYQITITDPSIFTESFELARTFVWRPARAIAEWDCEA